MEKSESVAAIIHLNFATLHDIIIVENCKCSGMASGDGKSFRTAINEQDLTIDEILNISNQICAGLSEAHKTKIVHRDIKPDTVNFVNNVYFAVNNVCNMCLFLHKIVFQWMVLWHWHGSCTFPGKDIQIKNKIRSMIFR